VVDTIIHLLFDGESAAAIVLILLWIILGITFRLRANHIDIDVTIKLPEEEDHE